MELERTSFSRPREGEYFDAGELTRVTGTTKYAFPAAALKELGDNALDACEAAGIPPQITVRLGVKDGSLWLTVSDNGPGIPAATVEGMLDFSRYVSDKEAYVSPTRGAQGNALKTIIGMPHALGSREPRLCTARGVRHTITSEVDPAGHVRIGHDREQVEEKSGTGWEVAFPADEPYRLDPVWWARSYAFVNPHASFEVIEQANSDVGEIAEIYKSSNPTFEKWLPSHHTPPHWYGSDELNKLVHSHIAHAKTGGRDLPVGEFVRQFRGLKAPSKAKKVTANLPGISHLSDLKGRESEVGRLLDAMQEHAQPPKHEALGRVGEAHFRECIQQFYGIRKDFQYAYVNGYDRGLPFVFEVAVAATAEPGAVHHAINHSPTATDPFPGRFFEGDKIEGRGLNGFSHNAHGRGRYGENTSVVAHLIHPAPAYADRGKSSIELTED